MKIRIEYRDLVLMGATQKQLDTYSNTDPLSIYQIGDNFYKVTGVTECETDAQGILDLLDCFADPDC